MRDIIWLLVIAGLVVLGFFLYFKFFKLLKLKSIVFVDGSLGTGKSMLSVSIAVRSYKKNLRRYKIGKAILGFLAPVWSKAKERLSKLEEPLLYSNIQLRDIKFVKLTKDLLFRQNFRFAYRSVLLIDEFSLLADQFCYKDREMSERLSNFFKLFRHEVDGGFGFGKGLCVVNSQSTSDLHYSLKYVLSDYLYIHHMTKYPFFVALKVQEMAYTADKDGGSVVAVHNGDIEESLKTMLVLKKYFRYYDSVCYSVFTDCLPVYRNCVFNRKGAYIKDTNLVSFKDYRFLMENIEKMEKERNRPDASTTQA